MTNRGVEGSGKPRLLPEGHNRVVPEAGIEPAHPEGWQILSLLRLPIPPLGQTLEYSRGSRYSDLELSPAMCALTHESRGERAAASRPYTV